MTIYEVQCPFCHVKHLIDSRKHMYKRYEGNSSGTYAHCQGYNCHRLFRVAEHELKEIKDPTKYPLVER